jgi:hypothetical protein
LHSVSFVVHLFQTSVDAQAADDIARFNESIDRSVAESVAVLPPKSNAGGKSLSVCWGTTCAARVHDHAAEHLDATRGDDHDDDREQQEVDRQPHELPIFIPTWRLIRCAW